MRKVTLFGLVAVGAIAVSAPVLAGGPPDTFTDTQHNVTETFAFEGPCAGGPGMVTITSNSVFHVTQFEDGRIHVSGNQTGKFSFDPDDPTLGTSTGSFTNGFNDNFNSNTSSSTSNFSARGRTEDGEMLRFHVTSHITVVGSDVIVQFDNVSCG
jgi:hypothetical protein